MRLVLQVVASVPDSHMDALHHLIDTGRPVTLLFGVPGAKTVEGQIIGAVPEEAQDG